MNLLAVLIIAVLAIPYLVIARSVAGHCAWWQVEHWWKSQKKPDGIDWTLATLAALIWPFAGLSFLVVSLLIYLGRSAPLIGAEKRAIQRARKKEHKKRAKKLGMPES